MGVPLITWVCPWQHGCALDNMGVPLETWAGVIGNTGVPLVTWVGVIGNICGYPW